MVDFTEISSTEKRHKRLYYYQLPTKGTLVYNNCCLKAPVAIVDYDNDGIEKNISKSELKSSPLKKTLLMKHLLIHQYRKLPMAMIDLLVTSFAMIRLTHFLSSIVGPWIFEMLRKVLHMCFLRTASRPPLSLHVIYINTSLQTKSHGYELMPKKDILGRMCIDSQAINIIIIIYHQIRIRTCDESIRPFPRPEKDSMNVSLCPSDFRMHQEPSCASRIMFRSH